MCYRHQTKSDATCRASRSEIFWPSIARIERAARWRPIPSPRPKTNCPNSSARRRRARTSPSRGTARSSPTFARRSSGPSGARRPTSWRRSWPAPRSGRTRRAGGRHRSTHARRRSVIVYLDTSVLLSIVARDSNSEKAGALVREPASLGRHQRPRRSGGLRRCVARAEGEALYARRRRQSPVGFRLAARDKRTIDPDGAGDFALADRLARD